MQVRPKRLGVCEGGVDSCDERGTPEVGRRPPVRAEFGGGGERERGWVEKGDEVGDEEAAVGDDLCENDVGRWGIWIKVETWNEKNGWKSATRNEQTRTRRTNEASKSAQGELDTASSGLRSTTGGTSVQTSIARV